MNESRFNRLGSYWLSQIGQFVYVLVGASFLIVALLGLTSAWINFFESVSRGVFPAIVSLTNDTLMILIILEVLETILSYLRTHVLLLEPFIYIGIIAAIRRILAAGASLSVLEGNANRELLITYLADLAMNTLVILILVFSVFLLSRASKAPAG